MALIVRDCRVMKDFHFSKGSEDVQLVIRRGELLTVQVKTRKKLHADTSCSHAQDPTYSNRK